MELIEGIKTRKSLRAFKPAPIPDDILKNVLAAASRSPSYTNTQPWEVAVVSGNKKEELSRRLLKLAESNVPGNPDIALPASWPAALDQRSKEHGSRRFTALGIERANEAQRRELRLANFRFHDAPTALILFLDRSLTAWSIFDMGLFAQTVCLAAHSFGLGTCLQVTAATYPDVIRDFLGLPKEKLILIAISIGYPDPAARINTYQSTRVTLDDFVRWHR